MQLVYDFVRVHHADNFGWALACCAWQREAAEDVLQEAYLRVLDGRAQFSGKSSHRTWFFAVIKRVAADVQRTQRRHEVLNLQIVGEEHRGDESENHSAGQPGDELQRDQSTGHLRQALLQLSARQREVLHLVFYAELTLEESAESLGISVGSARTHYHRGKERLAELLLSRGNDEEFTSQA